MNLWQKTREEEEEKIKKKFWQETLKVLSTPHLQNMDSEYEFCLLIEESGTTAGSNAFQDVSGTPSATTEKQTLLTHDVFKSNDRQPLLLLPPTWCDFSSVQPLWLVHVFVCGVKVQKNRPRSEKLKGRFITGA